MQWVIHIGTQKTGSKALQFCLKDGRLGDRVIYPHHGREWVWHEPLHDDWDTSNIEAATTAFADQSYDFGVFSCESFYDLPIEAVGRFHRALGDAKIVMFLRPQDHLANSLLNQYVKAHRVTAKEIRDFEQNLDKYSRLFDYRIAISKWSEVFGLNNMIPLIYDKRIDSVVDFCSTLGIDVRTYRPLASNPNPSLDAFSYAVIRKMKERIGDSKKLSILMSQAHARLGNRFVDTSASEPFDLIGAAKRRRIMEIYEESNEWIYSHWFPERKTLFQSLDEIKPPAFEKLEWSDGDDIVRELLLSVDIEY